MCGWKNLGVGIVRVGESTGGFRGCVGFIRG